MLEKNYINPNQGLLKRTLEGFQTYGTGVERTPSGKFEIRSIKSTEQRDMYKQLSQRRLDNQNSIKSRAVSKISNNSRKSCKLIAEDKNSVNSSRPMTSLSRRHLE